MAIADAAECVRSLTRGLSFNKTGSEPELPEEDERAKGCENCGFADSPVPFRVIGRCLLSFAWKNLKQNPTPHALHGLDGDGRPPLVLVRVDHREASGDFHDLPDREVGGTTDLERATVSREP